MPAELVIPDPRKHPVPPGWLEEVAAPAILATDDWDTLDDYEGRLRAFASYIESFNGDSLVYEKALRLVEKRRGDLSLSDVDSDTRGKILLENDRTISRWRTIARSWDRVWPVILEASERGAVTQAAILRFAKMGVHYSSDRHDWSTPQDLFDDLDGEFHFTLDVCATAATAKCKRYFSPKDDGLAQDWTGVCWMNPPYGDEIPRWIQKAYEAAENGTITVCLVPARIDTRWWWDYCRYGEVRFIRGRLRFGGGEFSAPLPSAVVIFGRSAKVIWWER